jgi:hypothetical protein
MRGASLSSHRAVVLTPHPQSFGSDFIRTETLDLCIDAFSSREPVSTSLENALDWHYAPKS